MTGKIIARKRPRLTGLAQGTPVVGGGGDQAASAVGNGIVEPGIVSCTLGTSGVVFAHMEDVGYDPSGRVHTFCHAVRDKWHVMGVTQGAGLSLQWFRNQLAPGTDYDALTAEAAQSPAGAQGLFWLPYLMGERTPHLDATARGGWIGLTAEPHPRRPDPRGHRRRLLQPARLPGHYRGTGRGGELGARLGRRRARARSGAVSWPAFWTSGW